MVPRGAPGAHALRHHRVRRHRLERCAACPEDLLTATRRFRVLGVAARAAHVEIRRHAVQSTYPVEKQRRELVTTAACCHMFAGPQGAWSWHASRDPNDSSLIMRSPSGECMRLERHADPHAASAPEGSWSHDLPVLSAPVLCFIVLHHTGCARVSLYSCTLCGRCAGTWQQDRATLGHAMVAFEIMITALCHPRVDACHFWNTRWKTCSDSGLAAPSSCCNALRVRTSPPT